MTIREVLLLAIRLIKCKYYYIKFTMLMLYILFILCRFHLAIVLFVLFRFTADDYPFGIFKPFVYPLLSVDIEMKFYTLNIYHS
jgi:hypothetical protein